MWQIWITIHTDIRRSDDNKDEMSPCTEQ